MPVESLRRIARTLHAVHFSAGRWGMAGRCDMNPHPLQLPALQVIYAGGMELGCRGHPIAPQAA